VDKVIFNQDKSQFAVTWKHGGFTKYCVATLKVEQQVQTQKPFQALAFLQKTKDYFYTLASVGDEEPSDEQCRVQNSQRDITKFFREKVRDIYISFAAKYTMITLESQVQVYSRNGRDLFDIVDCAQAAMYLNDHFGQE